MDRIQEWSSHRMASVVPLGLAVRYSVLGAEKHRGAIGFDYVL